MRAGPWSDGISAQERPHEDTARRRPSTSQKVSAQQNPTMLSP